MAKATVLSQAIPTREPVKAAWRRRDDARTRAGSLVAYRSLDSAADLGSLSLLADHIKADMKERFDLGEKPTVQEYLARHPELIPDADRVLSLIYEEYCLCDEYGKQPDTAEFCERYEAWKDSLLSQLQYHRVISQAVGAALARPSYPALGSRLGDFELLDVLGTGGAARVYLARETSLGDRLVALKVSASRGVEPALLGKLNHPNIVPVLSVKDDEQSGLRALCMAYEAGLPLDKLIDRLRDRRRRPESALVLWNALIEPADDTPGNRIVPLPRPGSLPNTRGWAGYPTRGTHAEAAAWVVLKLAEALTVSHALQIWHRDVKPANILISYEKGPQLLDFNLAHESNPAVEAATALRGGTLPYMAPEQLEAFLDGSKWAVVRQQADIYSLGLVLRELLTGCEPDLPEPGMSAQRTIRHLLDLRKSFDPGVKAAEPTTPHALEAITRRCLAYSPEHRYASAAQLVEDLTRYLQRQPLRHAANPSRRERASNWSYRHRLKLAAALFLMVISTAAGELATIARPGVQSGESRVPPLPAATTTAIEAFQASKIDRAFEALDHAPDSALTDLLRALGFSAREDTNATLTQLDTLWKRPEAAAQLRAASMQVPGLLDWCDALAEALLKSHRARDPIQGGTVAEHAERLVKVALDASPGRLRSRRMYAVAEEQLKHYQSAIEIVSRLIQEITPSNSQNRILLHGQLQTRSRIRLRWAEALLDDLTDQNLALVAEMLEQVPPDCQRGRELNDDAGEIAAIFDEYYEAKSLLLHGEVNRRRGEKKAARAELQHATEIMGHMPPDTKDARYMNELKALASTLRDKLTSADS